MATATSPSTGPLDRVCQTLLTIVTEQCLLEVEATSLAAQQQSTQWVAEQLRAEITRLHQRLHNPPAAKSGPSSLVPSSIAPPPPLLHHPFFDQERFHTVSARCADNSQRLTHRLQLLRRVCQGSRQQCLSHIRQQREAEESAFRALVGDSSTVPYPEELHHESQRRRTLVSSEESKIAHLESAVVTPAGGASHLVGMSRKAFDLCVQIGTLLEMKKA